MAKVDFSGRPIPFMTRVGAELQKTGLVVRQNEGNNGISIIEKDLWLEIDAFLLDTNFETIVGPQPVCVNAYRVDEKGRAVERVYPCEDEPHSKNFRSVRDAAAFVKGICDEVVLKAASDLASLGDEISSAD